MTWCGARWLLAAWLALGGCGEDDGTAFTELTLRGSVVDDFTDKALSGAQVVFTSDTRDETRAKTNEDGDFQMEVSVPLEVRFGRVKAERAGYQPSQELSVYFDGTSRRVELRLRPQPGSDE